MPRQAAATIVGITGGSGSGKTTVMERIARAVGINKITTLSIDSYYKDLSHLSPQQRSAFNFDDPQAFDVATLVSHLRSLKSGLGIPKVTYDYDSLRSKTGADLIESRPVVLLEGIFVLAIPSVRELLDIKVFVDTAPDLRFIRRCRRDITHHRRTFDDIAHQYERSVREMHNQLIEPSRDFADLVLPLDRTNDSGIDMLVRSIATLVSQQPARLIESPVDGSEMLLVPGGTFLMGTSDSHIDEMLREYGAQIHWFNDERPFHAVGLKSYYVDKYPVTNNQYRSFVKATGRDEPATWTIRRHTEPSQPVTGVSWEDAKAYAGWAGKRLPSEAEWEKAARGINARLFPWGSAPPEGRANFGGKYGGPTIVNKFPDGASPYGVMDMAGNVWEWAADWYDRDYYSKSPKDDPTGPPAGAGRCVRGGCWVNNPTMIRCAERDVRRLPLPELKYFGFRCAADV